MNIGYVFDEGFTLPAAVSMYSLMYNNKNIDQINFYILDDGITTNSKCKLRKMVEDFGRTISFVGVNSVKRKLETVTSFNWNGSYSTYLRLMLNSLLPNFEDTIIFIDADTVITGSVEELDGLDLEDKVCAMALEAMPLSYYKYSRLGLNELINGGLLVIDLKKWKEEKAEDKILYFLNHVRNKNMLTDEDVLSNLFKGRIKRLPPYLNYLTQYYMFTNKFYYMFFGWDKLSQKNVFYSLSELEQAKNKIAVYHCIDTFSNRPWFSNNCHPFSYLFDQYLAMTPWKDCIKPYKEMTKRRSIEYQIAKKLPVGVFTFLYSIVLRLYYGIGAKKYYSAIK